VGKAYGPIPFEQSRTTADTVRSMFAMLANGARTDHPIRGLPFVDDAHIPIADGRAVEAIGRMVEEGMWGRYEDLDQGWVSFTTDPINHEVAWIVRHHPTLGTAVGLCHDRNWPILHGHYIELSPMFFLPSGYWWDGSTWYRPPIVTDLARERWVRRQVPAATSITTEGFLATETETRDARLFSVLDFPSHLMDDQEWMRSWADRRATPERKAVIGLMAPELDTVQLVDSATLRAMVQEVLSDDELPPPQVVTATGDRLWARAVVRDFAEEQRFSPEGIGRRIAATAASRDMATSRLARVTTRLEAAFDQMTPGEGPTHHVGNDWQETFARAAAEVLFESSRVTFLLRGAILWEIRCLLELGVEDIGWADLTQPLSDALACLIELSPANASFAISTVIGEAERRYGVPVTSIVRLIGESLDDRIDPSMRDEFMAAHQRLGMEPLPTPTFNLEIRRRDSDEPPSINFDQSSDGQRRLNGPQSRSGRSLSRSSATSCLPHFTRFTAQRPAKPSQPEGRPTSTSPFPATRECGQLSRN
jgi:hypothetical protein